MGRPHDLYTVTTLYALTWLIKPRLVSHRTGPVVVVADHGYVFAGFLTDVDTHEYAHLRARDSVREKTPRASLAGPTPFGACSHVRSSHRQSR